jgi:hypothetical protein
MVEKALQALTLISVVVAWVSYAGLILRPNRREAPTWVVWGLLVGMVGMVGSAIFLLAAKLLRL